MNQPHRRFDHPPCTCDALEPRRLLAVVPYRWAGEKDPTTALMSVGQGQEWYDVAVTPERKNLIVGLASRSTAVYRFNPDGTRDNSFSDDGVTIFDLTTADELMTRVLPLAGGRMLIAGAGREQSGSPAFMPVFARLNENGSFDTGFGNAGVARPIQTGNWGDAAGLQLQSNGKYLFLSPNGMLARISETGTLDASFGSNGVLNSFNAADSWRTSELCVLPDDRFLVSGFRRLPGNVGSVARVARFLPDGAPDPSFGSGGVVEIDVTPGTWDDFTSMHVRQDGRILLGLATEYTQNSAIYERAELWQLLPDGVIDTSFGSGGSVPLSPFTNRCIDLEVDSVGRIIGSGRGGPFRLLANGMPDASFGIGGLGVLTDVDWQICLTDGDDFVGISSFSQSPKLFRVLSAPKGDGPVFLDPDTSKLHITGTLYADQITLRTQNDRIDVTLNASTTSIQLTPTMSLELDARFGRDEIVYDVGDAFSTVTNFINAGPIDYSINSPIVNTIQLVSGPVEGTVQISRSGEYYSNDITIHPAATIKMTADEAVTLLGTDDDDTVDVGAAQTTALGNIIHAPIKRIDGNGGNDLVRTSSNLTFNGGAGDDSVEIIGTGWVTLNGGAGNDQVAMSRTPSTSSATGALTESLMELANMRAVFLNGMPEELRYFGASGAETVSIRDVRPGTTVYMELSEGNDRVMLGTTQFAAPGSLRTIFGNVSVNLGPGTDTFNFNDSLSTRPAKLKVNDHSLRAADEFLFGSPEVEVLFDGAEIVLGTGSAQPDEFAVEMSSLATFTMSANQPAAPAPDGDILQLIGGELASLDLFSLNSGKISKDGYLPVSFSAFERWPILSAGGVIPVIGFDVDRASLHATFGADVGATLRADDLSISTQPDAQAIPIAQQNLTYDGATRQLQLHVAALLDGNYLFWINNQGIIDPATGQPLIADALVEFFVLAGDANRDRAIDAKDFAIMATHFNRATVFSQGDFNYDGVTNISDFAILASRFNTALPPARSPLATQHMPERRHAPHSLASLTTSIWIDDSAEWDILPH